MSKGDGYFAADGDGAASMPTAVKTVRVLLYVLAGATVLVIAGVLMFAGVSAELLGYLTWVCWPGIVGFVVALRMNRPGRAKFWLIVVVAAFGILNALGSLGQGDPRGVTTLIIPILILVFVLRRASRTYFKRSAVERAADG